MKKGKLGLIIISGLIGISVIGNMLGGSSNKINNNDNSKKQENESAKVEQKIEKTEEELKKEEEQKKREEEQKLEEKKKLEEQNKINTAIGAATAAGITNRNNNREEVRQERPVEEKIKGIKIENEVEYGNFLLIFNTYLNYVINKVKKYFINIEKDIEEELL